MRDKQRCEVDFFFRGVGWETSGHRERAKHSGATVLKFSARGETQPLEAENINDLSRLHRSHKKGVGGVGGGVAPGFLHSKIWKRK